MAALDERLARLKRESGPGNLFRAERNMRPAPYEAPQPNDRPFGVPDAPSASEQVAARTARCRRQPPQGET